VDETQVRAEPLAETVIGESCELHNLARPAVQFECGARLGLTAIAAVDQKTNGALHGNRQPQRDRAPAVDLPRGAGQQGVDTLQLQPGGGIGIPARRPSITRIFAAPSFTAWPFGCRPISLPPPAGAFRGGLRLGAGRLPPG